MLDERERIEDTFEFIDRLFEHRERISRDEVIGKAEQAMLPHQAVNVFGHLPPGPYTKDQLRALTIEALEQEPI